MNKKSLHLIIILVLFCVKSWSQEGLRPLYSNPAIIESDIQLKAENFTPLKKASTSLSLPFFDDFSYCWKSVYPNVNNWADSNVYVNHGYGIAPPSLGVATFDGLNKRGYPYQPELTNLVLSFPADTLTSVEINLKTHNGQPIDPAADKVGFSFYYQPRGYGDAPEINDSLIVDFYKPAQKTWNTKVWHTRGYADANKVDSGFKRTFLYLRDTAYFHDGFKFRFRNSATNIGNFDHWHIDYVYLHKNRDSIADTTYNDLTFGVIPGPLLKNYSAMPWQQYRAEELAPSYAVRIKNSSTQGFNMSYQMRILSASGSTVHSYDGTFANLAPFSSGGYSSYQPHKQPAYAYTFQPMADSTDFTILHYVYRTGTANDFVPENDTIKLKQSFRNVYAWDDGGAESGYYVLGTGSKIACKFVLNQADTIQGLRIYFDRTGSVSAANTVQRFKIILWSANGNEPGEVLLQSGDLYPKIQNQGNRDIYEYKLNLPGAQRVLQAGTYYIGIQQFISTGITIGFDRNYDFGTNVYYSTGKTWAQSQFHGSLLMRPVLGKVVPTPVGLSEQPISEFEVFPNPANTQLHFKGNLIGTFTLLTMDGRIIMQGSTAHSVDVSNLANGMYMIISHQKGLLQTRKVIIQH